MNTYTSGPGAGRRTIGEIKQVTGFHVLIAGFMVMLLISACDTTNRASGQAEEIVVHNPAAKESSDPLPPSYYNDPVLGPLPMVSLDPLGEAAGRLEGEAEHPDPSTYGYDRETGVFTHPAAAPEIEGPRPFKGSLTYIDMEQYIKNMEVVAYYPFVPSTGHTYQSVLDFDGRRYMYNGLYPDMEIYDITDPRDVKALPKPEPIDSGIAADGKLYLKGFFRYSPRMDKYYLIQPYAPPYVGFLENKYLDPERVKAIRNWPYLKGFRVFELTGPTEFKMVAAVTSDRNKAVDERPQAGGGCTEFAWDGISKYMFMTCSPDDSWANQPYRSLLYTYGVSAYDMTDPADPKYISTWHVPGQLLSEQEEFRKNPRWNNKASRMGARVMFVPKYPDDGGTYGYVPMGGWGFYIVDISDPANMKTVGKIDDFPVAVSGNEGDSIYVDVMEETGGYVFFNGYPLVEDCYEPYKNIYTIDVNDPANPKVVGTFPRPVPPEDAAFTDFCQRRGSFGPKRPGASGRSIQPGKPNPRYAPWSFYNAGVQVFDVSDPLNVKIAAYFVPKMMDPELNWHFGNPTNAVFVEWDRNLIYEFTNHGFYILSTPLLGEPVFGMPEQDAGIGRPVK